MIHQGDVRDVLRKMADGTIHTCVTSPPYWGLRDHGVSPVIFGGDQSHEHVWGTQIRFNTTNHVDKRRWNHVHNGRGEAQPVEKRPRPERTTIDQGAFCQCGAWRGALGLEPTPELYVVHLVGIFREVRRVLRSDGTLWLNLGDSYAGSWGNQGRTTARGRQRPVHGPMIQRFEPYPKHESRTGSWVEQHPTLKPKDLIGIPWRVAMALQADGWYLRSDIIWAKTNPMPESVSDRPTKSHEYLFLLSKSRRYFYDARAIREPRRNMRRTPNTNTPENKTAPLKMEPNGRNRGFRDSRVKYGSPELGRNKRSVWTIATHPFPGAHFATYPDNLVAPCIQAGTSERGCCPRCGAPWQRAVTKREASEINNHERWSAANTLRPFAPSAADWQSSCSHDLEAVPCTVLDPFSGSGTTGLVAHQLGRRFIGIELNPQYVQMGRERIAEQGRTNGFSPVSHQTTRSTNRSEGTQ